MNKITFIIPTIGRDTLLLSIKSLKDQTNSNWNAIIIFDGIKSNIENNDNRIKIIEIEKKGININSAGNVRNYGISIALTEWIAFLDDDDTIANDYIDTFYNELKLFPDIDLLIFRMQMDNRIIPKLDADNFYICDVGISFIMKKKIFDDCIQFIPDGAEDFLYLDLIRKKNYKIIISPFIKYFVRNKIYIMQKLSIFSQLYKNRVFINMQNPYIEYIKYIMLV